MKCGKKKPNKNLCNILSGFCRNLSFELATKAKGLQGYGLRGSPGVKARGSSGVTSHIIESAKSAREYEGVNLHIPKAIATLGDEVLVDSRNFRE